MKKRTVVAAALAAGCSTSSSTSFPEDTCGLAPVVDDFTRAAGAPLTGAWQETVGPSGEGITLALAEKAGRPAPSLLIEAGAASPTARARTWARPVTNGTPSGCAELVLSLRVDAVEGGVATVAALRFAGGASYALRVTPELALVLVETGAVDHELARASLTKGTWVKVDLLAWSGEPGSAPPVLQLEGRTLETALPARARGAVESVSLGLAESTPSPRVSLAIDDLDLR